MILGRYKSAHSLKENISHLINIGELDQALRLIHDFVERIITEPLCTSQVYGSKNLDDLCQKIGKCTLASNKTCIVRKSDRGQGRPVFVYVITKLQKYGGHTRVIEDFIKARPDAQHFILSTEISGKSDINYLMGWFAKHSDIRFEPSPHGNFHQRLIWVQNRLMEISAYRTYLFNHHQDSIAVAAIQPGMGLNASFYHHGDHHLCLGVYLSHLEHIDPHPMGFHNCRETLGINNTYIPLTVYDKGDRPTKLPFKSNGILTTCTAARSNKVEIPYFVSYLDVLPKLLKVTGGRHVHIGRLTPWALFKIRQGLKRHGVQPGRFIYTPWVPSIWKALHDFRVDLYIASFPYGGGLTLIEAMGAGVPVALHRHLFSRILSGIDIAYPEAFCWRSPGELLDFCSTLSPEYLQEAGRLARMQYEKCHRHEILEKFLDDQNQVVLKPANLTNKFVPENDEWAFWMENQLSFGRVFRRGIYRLFRGIRARFF